MLSRHDVRSYDGNYAAVLPRPFDDVSQPLDIVRSILDRVRSEGDEVIFELGERFDGSRPDPLLIDRALMSEAVARVDPAVVASLEAAAKSIDAFYRSGADPNHSYTRDGLHVSARRQPVDRAGCYVPGGRAAYPSTVLMTAIPARVAQVPEVVVCVPPGPDGKVNDLTLAAASIAGVDRVYAVGGAQAIAAMAYGTATVDPVDVIVGPGNVFVALAKQEVGGLVGVPAAFAGPSEICVVADADANPTYAAIDLMVQAEHGPDGLSWLITADEAVIESVEAEISRLLEDSVRRDDIESTLAKAGHVAIVRDHAQAIDVANAIAPEHLQLMIEDAEDHISNVRHAGAVFIGELAPASLGDYIAGPSHVLPTNGTARFGGALGLEDFCKHVHIVRVEEPGFRWMAPHVEVLASAEGFDAHARSVALRLEDLDSVSHDD